MNLMKLDVEREFAAVGAASIEQLEGVKDAVLKKVAELGLKPDKRKHNKRTNKKALAAHPPLNVRSITDWVNHIVNFEPAKNPKKDALVAKLNKERADHFEEAKHLLCCLYWKVK